MQVGRGVGGLAKGVWGGVSGQNQKDKEAGEEGEEEEGEGESAGGKGSFF